MIKRNPVDRAIIKLKLIYILFLQFFLSLLQEELSTLIILVSKKEQIKYLTSIRLVGRALQIEQKEWYDFKLIY